jgi:hypothetical protein
MMGRVLAASTSATIEGDEEREVISQPEPTSCIHPPISDTREAIQMLRNNRF